MAMTPAERQARYRQRLKEGVDGTLAYEVDLLKKQVAILAQKLNEVRAHVGKAEFQLPKSAHKPQR
jgi:hypothetical protein